MIPYPHIPPEIFRIGPFAVRWYGMMYVLGFASIGPGWRRPARNAMRMRK